MIPPQLGVRAVLNSTLAGAGVISTCFTLSREIEVCRPFLWRSLLVAVLVCFSSSATKACPVCLEMPQSTMADRLIAASDVVFARENSNKPFSFITVEVLKGDQKTSEIDVFADSTTRRLLRSDQDRVAILIRSPKTSQWTNLGVADAEFQQIVRRILLFASEWSRPSGKQQRVDFFLHLINHSDAKLRDLAYLELGRASYEMIRQLGKIIPREIIRPYLRQPRYHQWRSLAVLMLAQEPSDEEREFIKAGFHSCSRFSMITNLGAWVTAYIEVDPDHAIDLIDEHYLANQERSAEEINAVIAALLIHEQFGTPRLRKRIRLSYDIARRNHPGVAKRLAAKTDN